MSAIVITVLFVAILIFAGCYGLHETRPKEWAVYRETLNREGRQPYHSFRVVKLVNVPTASEGSDERTSVVNRVVSTHDSYAEAADAYRQYTAY
jgi:hypothetical protein